MREVELLVRRLVRFVPLCVVLLCFTLAARAATTMFEAHSLKPVAEAAPVVVQAPVLVVEPEQEIGTDVFQAPPEVTPVVDKQEIVGPPPMTGLPLKLVATQVPRDARFASATIADTRLGVGGAYFLGDVIEGAGPIVAITPRWVDFENRAARRVERLDLLGAPPPNPPPPPPKGGGASSGSSAGDAFTAEVQQGVKKVDDTHFQVARSLVDKVLGDPSLVGARAMPQKNGAGVKLFGVRQGSPLGQLGLQNGDVLMAVNGYELNGNFDKLMELYTKLKTAASVSMQVQRGGKTVTFEYAVK